MCSSNTSSVRCASSALVKHMLIIMSSTGVETYSVGIRECYNGHHGTVTILCCGGNGNDRSLPLHSESTCTLEMDNNAARIFCLGTAHKTKLNHIDCCQEWVRALHNRNIMALVHVGTLSKKNDAHSFTKI